MSRPLMQRKIAELEALFASSKDDGKGLRILEEELKLRHVPRAVTLLGEVQALLAGPRQSMNAPPSAGPRMTMELPTRISMPRSFQETPAPLSRQPAKVSSPGPAAISVPLPERSLPPAPGLGTAPYGSSLAMNVQEACQILRVSPGADWLVIEQSRRQLVQLSHPQKGEAMDAAKRALALTAAKRVNAAYALLWQWRTEGR